MRNEIKNSPSNVEFFLITNQIASRFTITIKEEEIKFIQYLDICNKEKAIKNRSYTYTVILDTYFPEMLQFWDKCFSILECDLRKL